MASAGAAAGGSLELLRAQLTSLYRVLYCVLCMYHWMTTSVPKYQYHCAVCTYTMSILCTASTLLNPPSTPAEHTLLLHSAKHCPEPTRRDYHCSQIRAHALPSSSQQLPASEHAANLASACTMTRHPRHTIAILFLGPSVLLYSCTGRQGGLGHIRSPIPTARSSQLVSEFGFSHPRGPYFWSCAFITSPVSLFLRPHLCY